LNQKHKRVVLHSLASLIILCSLLVLLLVLINSTKQPAHAQDTYSNGDPSVTNGTLSSVVSLSSTEAYAAGWEGTYPGQGLIEHYVSGSWQREVLPANTGPLYSISADSPSDIWASGSYGDQPVILHGHASSWTSVPLPNEFVCYYGAGFKHILAFSSSDVWAAGSGCSENPLIMHWDGTSWSTYYDPSQSQGSFMSIAGTPNNLYAVGWSVLDGPRATHWDGNSWQTLPQSALPHYDNLTGASVMSDGTVWASSQYGALANYNPISSFWTTFDTSSHPGVDLSSLSQQGDQLYAVGEDTTHGNNGADYTPSGYHFDGTTWNYFTLPKDSNPMDFPASAGIALDGTVLIAGGSYTSFPTNGLPMIWQMNSVEPTPSPSASPTQTATPSPTPAPQSVSLSFNYAGFQATDSNPPYTSVQGEWTVTKITNCPAQFNSTLGEWVGLAGSAGHAYIQQIGTADICSQGKVHYYAWTEMIGSSDDKVHDLKDYGLHYQIQPGDLMQGAVIYKGGDSYTLKLSDLNNGHKWSFVSPLLHSGTTSASIRQDARWIFEDRGGNTDLPTFTATSFTKCTADDKAISNGPILVRYMIGTYNPKFPDPGAPIRIYTSPLRTNGKGFKIQFKG